MISEGLKSNSTLTELNLGGNEKTRINGMNNKEKKEGQNKKKDSEK